MSDPLEPRIKEALARLMAAAPQPRPLPDGLRTATSPARRHFPAWLVAPVAAAVAAAAIGVPLCLLRGRQESSDMLRVAPSASRALDATDALVVVTAITPLDLVTMESGAQYQRFEVWVQEVLYRVTTPNQAVDPDYPQELPSLEPGVLLVYEPLGSDASRRGAPAVSHLTEVTLAPGERAVVLLGSWAPEVYWDWPAAWSVVGFAHLEADGGLAFVEHPEVMEAGLAAAAAGAAPGLSPVEQLVAWLAEKDFARSGAPEGPMQAAYDASRTPWATTSTSLPSSTTSIPEGSLLEVAPSEGRPGDPLVICGYLPGGSQVRVSLYDPGSWFVWPEEVDEFTDVDGSGRWCWTGTIPRELENTEPGFQGERRPIRSGVHEIRLESFGYILGYAHLTVDASEVVEEPSQSPENARRDGVVAAVAELPMSLRVDRLVEVPATEGTWVLSRLTDEVMEATGASVGRFGETDAVTPEEVISTVEYGEILLIDGAGAIARAYPMPAAPPSWILTTWDAIYAGRVGDGAMPGSTLVRIDRRSLEAEVVLILTGKYYGQGAWPHSWRIADPEQAVAFEGLVVTDDVAGTPAESWIGPVTVDLPGIDRFLAGLRLGVEQVDLVAASTAAPEADLAWDLRLPWGWGPGQVNYSADFGPCCLAVTPDGAPIVANFSRLQVWDGATWRVFYGAGPALADGLAVLDSGLIAVPAADSPDDDRILLVDLDGNIVQQGEARREANNGWWGGEDLWAVLGMPPFTIWAPITAGGTLLPVADQMKLAAFTNSALTFRFTYDRRGDYDPAYNFTTVTLTIAGETRQWLLYGGDVAGAPRFASLDDGVLGLWIAGSDYLVVTLRPGRPVGVARIPIHQWVQTGTFDFYDVHDGRLYLLQTYPDGARVEVYDLP